MRLAQTAAQPLMASVSGSLVTEACMVVVGLAPAPLILIASLYAGWCCAWAPWTRVALFAAFATSAAGTAVAAGHDSTVGLWLAAATLAVSIAALGRMLISLDGPGLGPSPPDWVRRRRWKRFERSFWDYVDTGGR
jgi:hypothetical protein